MDRIVFLFGDSFDCFFFGTFICGCGHTIPLLFDGWARAFLFGLIEVPITPKVGMAWCFMALDLIHGFLAMLVPLYSISVGDPDFLISF